MLDMSRLGESMVDGLIQARNPVMRQVTKSFENSNRLEDIEIDRAELVFADELQARITQAIADNVDVDVVLALKTKYKKYVAG